jgi:putative flippase GtrA
MKLWQRLLTFILVGGGNTLLDFLCYTAITLWILPKQEQLVLAGVVSGTIALAIAYCTHRFITWRDKHVSNAAVIRFFLFTGFGMWVIRPILLWAFAFPTQLYRNLATWIQSWGIPITMEFTRHTCAFLAMTVIVVAYNFVTYAKFVFTDTAKETR